MVDAIYMKIKQIESRRKESVKLTNFYNENFLKEEELEWDSIQQHRKIFLNFDHNNSYLKVTTC